MKGQNQRPGLSDQQELLLDLLLAEEGLAEEDPAHIPPREAEGPVPLTDAQMRIWLMEKMDPGSTAYLISTSVRLRFPLEPMLLEEAFGVVWDRHEALRMTFREVDGQVWQYPNAKRPALQVADLPAMNGDRATTTMSSEMRAESARPFDLSSGPLVRLKLLRLNGDDFVFILTTHHLITDGWSINLLLRELVAAYGNMLGQPKDPRPNRDLQFGDYALWQKEWLEGSAAREQLDYWREKLQDPPAVIELPADFARPRRQTFNGAQARLRLDAALVRDIRRLSRDAGVTPFMTLLAAFKVLLHRQTGQTDIIIGSPVAGRQRPELESAIGLFLNTLVLRTDLGGDPGFMELLARVRRTATDAFANQEIPFERLLIELQPTRDPGRTPFFQIFFNMLSFDEAPAFDQEAVEFLNPPDLASKFDLTLYLEEVGNRFDLTAVYNRDLFDGARIDELLRQYKRVLEQAVANPRYPASAFDLVTENARTIVPDPTTPLSDQWEGPVVAALERHACRAPNEIAAADDDVQWTYGQAQSASNQLAHALWNGGVRKGDVVAIAGHRCAALVPALMATLKIGAIFLVLDPSYPEGQRLEYLNVARPAGWLTFAAAPPSPALVAAAETTATNASFVLPNAPEQWEQRLGGTPQDAPAVEIGPDDPACLTFTSGSTGKPKGIIGRHGSLTHFYPWMAKRFNLSSKDRFSMLSGLAHDPLQRDIFTAIWSGATIMVPDPKQMWEPGYLPRWMQANGITVAHLIPSMLYAISATRDAASVPSLRLALFVGEPLIRQNARVLRRLAPNVQIVNLYGTSETQRAVAFHEMDADEEQNVTHLPEVPLGRAMPGAQLLVLNERGEPAGIGEFGELYMRSHHLALGYWQSPEMSAERFLVNPWAKSNSDRLYRTGDFGRYRPDGKVTFAGRRDRQVSIRGTRVELSAIQALLCTHPHIAAAAVDTFEDAAGMPQIVAYVVQRIAGKLNVSDVRTLVRSRFPAAVVPASVQFIDAIPLTPNGKTDRSALPRPTPEENRAATSTPPTNAVEETLVRMWERLLRREPIGIHDDFFELGGHSLLAVRLFSEIRDQFGVELNLGTLFQFSTISEIAALLRQEPTTGAARSGRTNVIPVQLGAPDKPRFFCVHGAGGNVLFMEGWRKHFGDWSLYGLESPGVDGISWPDRSIEALAEEYVDNIQRVQPQGPYVIGGYSGGGILAYEIAQQLQDRGQIVRLLVLIDTYHPSVQPRPFSWTRRLKRLILEPAAIVTRIYTQLLQAITLRRLLRKYVALGKRVPLHMREPLIAYYYVKSKQRYAPEPYTGPALLFHSRNHFAAYEHAPRHLGWDGIIENLEIVDLPGNHFNVVKDPQAGQLIGEVKAAWRRQTNP